MCGNIGLSELIVILMLLVLVFGASRLPQLGESVGKTIRNFKRALAENDDIEVTVLKKNDAEKKPLSGQNAQATDAEWTEHKDEPKS